jgi:hypothetical protein
LAILLAEDGDVGLHEVKELENDSAHAMKESGPRRAFELVRERRRLHAIDLRRRIHLLLLRREQHVDAFALETLTIGLHGSRVAVEILVRPELQPVDENARDDGVAVLAGDPAQRKMAGVQVAHRRHERYPAGTG